MAKRKCLSIWSRLSGQNISHLALGVLFLSMDGRERCTLLARPTPTGPLVACPVLAGLGGGTYVEFFILCDDFSIGEDGGRRAFGEWIG